MTPKNSLIELPIISMSLFKPMFIVGLIALMVIVFFVSGFDNPKPEWGELWYIKPLIITPIVGALGGVFFYLINNLRLRGKLATTIAVIISLIGYVFALWMGIILGLNGTMWD
ncbi:MAG: potassium transporter KefB [Bacteroidota bacterium]|nr:potassium transporter KefB [Bacteroidota bacterium]